MPRWTFEKKNSQDSRNQKFGKIFEGKVWGKKGARIQNETEYFWERQIEDYEHEQTDLEDDIV